MEGLIGRKVGMTQVWDDQGRRVTVTVIEAGPCPVVQVKTRDNDGYAAAQLGFDAQKPQRLSKALRTRYEKAGAPACRVLREFRLEEDEPVRVGDKVGVGIFQDVPWVDVLGVTKGRGFAGVMRRYNMRGGPQTHGGHSKRRIGASGQCELPGRIQKKKRMPGHMGSVRVKMRNLAVVQVRDSDNLLLVRGSVPGAAGSYVTIRKSAKKV